MFIEKIMNGSYWFIPASLMLCVFSCWLYFYFAYKDYDEDYKQERYVTMSVRLIIGSVMLVVVSLLYAVLPFKLTAALALLLMLIALILMVNVEKLPIWEDR